ncbi:hypothetical protein [Loigolactobacillus backii]|uniref:Uncharacterized protein n=1 Tax=Loigolactobacillus backii TaxID=375175 RepID=A0A192H361_9LACO|nr:hypothetical protein [Loigolactobacillus backii]ANK59912.1 hypothetical protein AYR52_06345 [Loigolactobacillus backii]ANK63249.1 hypothetical protein AYR53_11015 [Loigolactobacillus backii]ANK64847.1 hypothetical protein AYR54_06030 [Loigolactobacillus backii]ANK66706.1 hypothetical protein AYR55_02725 [Loigolactobacillus backii]ANK69745.1 hypothetical protein AYR56_05990 [Loigolactobacillus backii]
MFNHDKSQNIEGKDWLNDSYPVGQEVGSPMHQLLEEKLISKKTFNDYFNHSDKLAPATRRALAVLEAANAADERLFCSNVKEFKLRFKNRLPLVLPSESMARIYCAEKSTDANNTYETTNFLLIINLDKLKFLAVNTAETEKSQYRLLNCQDITAIELDLAFEKLSINVVWSPASVARGVNLRQRSVIVDRALFVYAREMIKG